MAKDPVRIKRPTIGDVARVCGLSKTTVSKVMNVSAEEIDLPEVTRQRVLAACRKLAYQPSWQARALRQGKTHTLALIDRQAVPLYFDIWHRLMRRLNEAVHKAGYHIQLVPVPPEETQWRQTLREARFDGCLVFNNLYEEVSRTIRECGLPTVLINAKSELFPSVVPDDRQGAYMLTRHLIELGHRRVGFVLGAEVAREHFSVSDRLAGYRQAMAEANLPETTDLTNESFAAGVAFPTWPQRPTAVVIYNANSAIPFLHGCWTKGVRVPEDLSVGTFNDVMATQHNVPPLTTIDIPAEEMGQRAVDLLLAQIQAREQESAVERPGLVLLPERLIVRESTRALHTSS